MRHATVLFDLDGTLIDSGPLILSSFRHATSTVLGREIPDGELLAGVGGHGLVEQMRAFDPERVDELVAVYRAHNLREYGRVSLFDGVRELLEALRGEGRAMGVVTVKGRAAVDLTFSLLELDPLFDVVVTSEDCERQKPAPDPILAALEALGATADSAVYIGDAPFDIQAAHAAAVRAIAVSWGGIHPLARVVAERPDLVVNQPSEVLDVV